MPAEYDGPDGWISRLLWFDLDNLPPRGFLGDHGAWRYPVDRAALTYATEANRDLKAVVRDQQRHIRSLEEQLFPMLVHEVPAEQDSML